MKTTDEKRVLEWANVIMVATKKSLSVSLGKAWALLQLANALKEGVVTFAYEKSDGSLRIARGTLINVGNKVKGTRSESMSAFCYYDLEAKDFRSFKVENLVIMYA